MYEAEIILITFHRNSLSYRNFVYNIKYRSQDLQRLLETFFDVANI